MQRDSEVALGWQVRLDLGVEEWGGGVGKVEGDMERFERAGS